MPRTASALGTPGRTRTGSKRKVLIIAHPLDSEPFTLAETSIPALGEILLASACRQLPSLRLVSRMVSRDSPDLFKGGSGRASNTRLRDRGHVGS